MWVIAYDDNSTSDANFGACSAAYIGHGSTRDAAMQNAVYLHNLELPDPAEHLEFADIVENLQGCGFHVTILEIPDHLLRR